MNYFAVPQEDKIPQFRFDMQKLRNLQHFLVSLEFCMFHEFRSLDFEFRKLRNYASSGSSAVPRVPQLRDSHWRAPLKAWNSRLKSWFSKTTTFYGKLILKLETLNLGLFVGSTIEINVYNKNYDWIIIYGET